MFTIYNYEKGILAVGYQTKNIKHQDKWKHLNHMPIQSFSGTNNRLPLSHMDKSYIQLEETKELINEFSIGYMIYPTLTINKALKEEVNQCMKPTFGKNPTSYQ